MSNTVIKIENKAPLLSPRRGEGLTVLNLKFGPK